MENRYYIKTIIPFIKLLVETIESLEKTNNNLTENLIQTRSKLAKQTYDYVNLQTDYDHDVNELEK